MINEKLKIAVDKQAKQIARLKKVGKKPKLEKYWGTALALAIPVLNKVFSFGLSYEEILIYMVPILMMVYLGKNKNAN